jgi:hypothetical protein
MMFSNTRFPLTAGNQRLSEISLLTHTSPSSSRTQSEGQLVPDYAYPELLPPVVAESQKFFGEITWNPRCRKDQRKSTTYHQYQLPKLPATSMRDTEIVILPAAIYLCFPRERVHNFGPSQFDNPNNILLRVRVYCTCDWRQYSYAY